MTTSERSRLVVVVPESGYNSFRSSIAHTEDDEDDDDDDNDNDWDFLQLVQQHSPTSAAEAAANIANSLPSDSGTDPKSNVIDQTTITTITTTTATTSMTMFDKPLGPLVWFGFVVALLLSILCLLSFMILSWAISKTRAFRNMPYTPVIGLGAFTLHLVTLVCSIMMPKKTHSTSRRHFGDHTDARHLQSRLCDLNTDKTHSRIVRYPSHLSLARL